MKKQVFLFPIFILILFILSCNDSEEKNPVITNSKIRLSGTIVDAVTKEIIPGAVVFVDVYNTVDTSDEDGKYSLTFEKPGLYHLSVSKENYLENNLSLELSEESENKTIELYPVDSSNTTQVIFNGIVINSSTDEPVENAVVSVEELNTQNTTSADGSFILLFNTPGKFKITIQKTGFKVTEHWCEILDSVYTINETINLEFDYENIYSDQDPDTQILLKQLDASLSIISGSDPNLDDTDLNFLDQFADTKIVGLGEATHGTKEFFQMKHRIFKYLVEKHNFKVFAFEADFAESIPVDRYVTTGEGNLHTLMTNVMHFWTWRTKEVKELLEWMKDYNLSRSEEDKIHFIGYDCQINEYYPGMIRDYLLKVDAEFIENINLNLTVYEENDQREFYDSMSTETFEYYKEFFEEITQHYIVNKANFISQTGKYEYEINLQLTKVLSQIHHQSYDRSFNYRDKYMAENHSWILDLFNGNEKIVSWAHNLHVFKDEYYYKMGTDLRIKYGDDYKVIGFGFSQGGFQAIGNLGLVNHSITSKPPLNSSNYILHTSIYDNFCLDLNAISYPELETFFLTSLPFLDIGAVFNSTQNNYYHETILKKDMDVLIYFDKTNAAEKL